MRAILVPIFEKHFDQAEVCLSPSISLAQHSQCFCFQGSFDRNDTFALLKNLYAKWTAELEELEEIKGHYAQAIITTLNLHTECAYQEDNEYTKYFGRIIDNLILTIKLDPMTPKGIVDFFERQVTIMLPPETCLIQEMRRRLNALAFFLTFDLELTLKRAHVCFILECFDDQ